MQESDDRDRPQDFRIKREARPQKGMIGGKKW